MVVRQLRADQYETVMQFLLETAHSSPLDASHTISITVNESQYWLRVQPCQKRKIAVLQAWRLPNGRQKLELITNNLLLSSLFELFLLQSLPVK